MDIQIPETGEFKRIAEAVFQDVIRAGKELFAGDDPDWADRSCSILAIGPADVMPTVKFLLGGPGGNFDRQLKYQKYSGEKYRRLCRYVDEGHLTSYESRDPSQDKWGGAIVVPIGGIETIFSTSGLPEAGDEAYDLILNEVLFPTDYQVARRCSDIVDRTLNPYYEKLRAAVIH